MKALLSSAQNFEADRMTPRGVVRGATGVAILMVCVTPAAWPKQPSESSALSSLRLIAIEEAIYASTYPTHGFACSLVAMGGDSKGGPPTPESAQLLPADLASGKKDGYLFSIDHCVPIVVKGNKTNMGFTVSAVPEESHGQGTRRGFCVDQDMKITVDPKGGTNCTEPFGVV